MLVELVKKGKQNKNKRDTILEKLQKHVNSK